MYKNLRHAFAIGSFFSRKLKASNEKNGATPPGAFDNSRAWMRIWSTQCWKKRISVTN
jgi:hypothetical protein